MIRRFVPLLALCAVLYTVWPVFTPRQWWWGVKWCAEIYAWGWAVIGTLLAVVVYGGVASE